MRVSKHHLRPATIGVIAGLILVPAAAAQQADREHFIDIDKLNQAITRATEALAHPLQETRLSHRFAKVNTLLQAEDLDKEALIGSLERLSTELERFVDRLDTSPIFEAEMEVGKTIDRIRMVMAAGPAGKPRQRISRQVVEHERQLRELVTAIDAEPDPRREKRLKMVFSHHLRLKKLKEQMGKVDLTDARMLVFARTAEVLDGLSTQLISAAFRAEEARSILSEQSVFLATYIEIINGVVGAQEIARVLSGLGGTGSQLSLVISELTIVATQAAQFSQQMDALTLRLSDEIDVMGSSLNTQIEASHKEMDLDIDKEMDRYRRQPRHR